MLEQLELFKYDAALVFVDSIWSWSHNNFSQIS